MVSSGDAEDFLPSVGGRAEDEQYNGRVRDSRFENGLYAVLKPIGEQTIRIVAYALMGLLPTQVSAQSSRTATGEIGGYGGGMFGIGSHAAVGSTLGTSFTRYDMLVLDIGFMPLGTETLRNYHGQVSAQTSRLYDFNLSVHIRIPIRGPVEPYGIVGGGLLHNTYDAGSAATNNGSLVNHYSDDNFGFHTGAGARYYLRENWGIRGEYRVTISNQPFSRVSAGIFYQFE